MLNLVGTKTKLQKVKNDCIKKTETLVMDILSRKCIKGKSKKTWYLKDATEYRKDFQFSVDLCVCRLKRMEQKRYIKNMNA